MRTAREFADRAAELAASASWPDPAVVPFALVSIALSLAKPAEAPDVLEELRAEIVALDALTKSVSGAPRGPLLTATHNTLLTVLEAIDRRAAYLAGVGA